MKLSELLRFIAENESLSATVSAFPSLDRPALRAKLLEAASRLESAEGGFAAASKPPAPSRGSAASVTKRVRVYSDGAARGNPGPSGAGAVIATPDGAIIERLGKFLGIQTNNVAEYTALILGLEQAKAMGADAVDVFADSELMIRQLEGRYQVKAPGLRPLFDKAAGLLRTFKDFKLQHIPRAQNAEADEMSNRAIDERM